MAKSTKPKEATRKTEEVKPVISPIESLHTPEEAKEVVEKWKGKKDEPVIGDVPPSVTLSEVEAVKEPLVEEINIEVSEPAKTDEFTTVKTIEVDNLVPISNEQKILNYLDDKPKGEIRMNDFLKSLFGVSKFNELPTWQNQGASKEVRNLLGKINGGEYEVMGNAHLKLGTTYYPDTSTMRAMQHDLGSVAIFVKKVN